MKKNVIKKIVMLLAVCTVSAFTLGLTGCDVKETLKEKIEQARCEHEFGDVVTVEESTCTKAGYGEKTCPKCNKVEKVDFDKKEHIAIVVVSVPSTCTKQGLQRNLYAIGIIARKGPYGVGNENTTAPWKASRISLTVRIRRTLTRKR